MTIGYRISETALFNTLFGSANFVEGGIGKTDQRVALSCTTEQRLTDAANERNATVILLGTDYVVFKKGVPARNVSKSPLSDPPEIATS